MDSRYTYFSSFYNDTADSLRQAQEDISTAFPPGSSIKTFTDPLQMPENYNPGTLPSLTMVYGTGEEYKAGGTVVGGGRRRLGSGGSIPRDYTVFVSLAVRSSVFFCLGRYLRTLSHALYFFPCSTDHQPSCDPARSWPNVPCSSVSDIR